MLSKPLVVLTTLTLGVLAAPRNTTSSRRRLLNKRAVPSFEPGVYSQQRQAQVDDGHWDAIMMADSVVNNADNRPPPSATPYWFDEIFRKYFNIEDMPTIVGEYQR